MIACIFIFDCLDSASDQEAFGLTCKQWLRVQNLGRRSLQSQCSFTNIGAPSLSQSHITVGTLHLSRLLNCFQQLHFLSLSGCVDLPDSDPWQNCRELRAVRITNCRNVTGVGFKGCSEMLRYIEVNNCKLEPEGIMGIVSGGGLKYLNVSCLSWSIYGDGLAAIGAGFGNKLRVLDYLCCRTIGDSSIIAL